MFRRENKPDTFDRQMDALRDQLGDGDTFNESPPSPTAPPAEVYAGGQPTERPRDQDRPRDFGFGQAIAPAASRQVGPEQPEVPVMPEIDSRTTVIAADTQWKGDITSEGSVHILGRFDGSVRAKVAIFVAEGSEVDAALTSDSIVVAGSSKGSIRAQSRFEVLPSGRVAGDIVSPTLVVHEGATIAGQLRMAAGEAAPETALTPVVQRRAARGTA